MKTLPVRLVDLTAALEDHSRELLNYYFDTQSGEVVFLSDEMGDSDKRRHIVLNNSERFVEIEPMDSRKGFAIMEQFIAMLPSTPLREKLQWSLEGPKPFRRFRDTLLKDLPVRDQWHEFHAESMRKIALEWLANLGIGPVEPANTGAPSLLDREAHGLKKTETSDHDFEETGEQELDENRDDNFDEFDEEGYSETVDLSEEEEAELADFVESLPGAGFNIAKLHGLLSAFAAGPETLAPADILALLREVAGLQNTGDTGESAAILKLLSRFYGGITEALEFESFAPQLQQKGVMVTDPGGGISSWCSGFMLAVDRHKTPWQPWFEDLRRAKAISLIAGLAEAERLRQLETAIGEETAWTAWNMIGELVPLIRDYWAFESALNDYLGPQPDNPELKVGRNDPCPCGSGKKFKHCHGRA
jgi:yecA family protein